jgi:hypothetical protein
MKTFEECRFLGCDAGWLLLEPTFQMDVASHLQCERINELGTTLAVNSN